MISRGTIVLLIIAFVAALTIGLLYAFCRIDTAQTLEITALTTLVLITAWYAVQTTIIAKATKEQRYSESLPLLVPTIPPILSAENLPLEAMQSGNTVKVVWCNVGNGVAINSRFSFWTVPTSPGRAWFFPPRESVTLEVKGTKKIDYSEILNDSQNVDVSGGYIPRLEAEYQDIYERKITTVQEFRIEKQNDIKRVLLGELYFTINGRRLGKEATPND